ncbi:hypothetical protein J1614_007486, partial [Plenodomus biglobosus]
MADMHHSDDLRSSCLGLWASCGSPDIKHPKSFWEQTATPQAAIEAGAVSEPRSLKRQLQVVCLDQSLAATILALPLRFLALPAAAAGLAYVNARHGLAYDYHLLSSFLRGTLSSAWNERADRLNFFYQLRSHALSSRAHHAFLIFQGQTWSYAQAYETVLKYATWLTTKGVAKDDIVAMDLVNSHLFVWLWFALWSIGAKPAFVNTNLRGKALVHTLKTSTARLVLVDEEGRDKYDEQALKEHGLVRDQSRADQMLYSYDMDESDIPKPVRNQTATPQAAIGAGVATTAALRRRRRQLQVVCVDPSLAAMILTLPTTRLPDSSRSHQTRTSMAMLIYTSGTTGLPKPAIMSWGKANAAATGMSLWLNLKNEVVYTSMPLYHSAASILGVCATLRAGGTICLSKKFSHKTFWPEIRASNATLLHYVGETCRYLLSAPASVLDKQHKIHTAFGNGLRPDVWEPFKARFGITHIYEFYAATESPGGLFNHSANSFSSGAIGRTGTIASLIMSKTMAIIRIDTTTSPPMPLRSPHTNFCLPCAPSQAGELVYALDPANTHAKFQGYFNNASATHAKIIRNVFAPGDAYFRSGDLVRRDALGRWWFVDRIGDTFRWKAENVSTAEVAEVLGGHPAVAEANVYGVHVPGYDGRAGCAALVLKNGFTSSSDSSTPFSQSSPSQSKNITNDTLPLSLPTQQTLHSLSTHLSQHLPPYARPLWLRITRHMPATGTMKQQKTALQDQGIDVRRVEGEGDVLFWFRGGRYVRFGEGEGEM